jgi:hypothetical protein
MWLINLLVLTQIIMKFFLISKNKEVEKFNKTTKSEIAKKLSNKILHALIQ